MRLSDRAKGRWDEILSHIGIDDLALDGKHRPCPGCGGTDRFRYLKDEHGGYFCGDERGDGVMLVQHFLECDFKTAAAKIEEVIGKTEVIPRKEKTWAERLLPQVRKSPRSRYLESRGLEVAPGIRWINSIPYFSDDKEIGRFPAMMCPVMRGEDFLTFHVTYLKDGLKAPVDPCRKILPGPSLNGASVPLYPAGEVLGIAEGIETAIAAKMLTGIPTWAALNTSLMKSFDAPQHVKKLVIFSDNDHHYAGQASAYALASRLSKKIEVQIRIPNLKDWNDELLAAKEIKVA